MRRSAFILGTLLLQAISALASVNVTSPGNGSSVQSPVHFVATATSNCSKGVASMGIYTPTGVLAYVVKGAKLDTNLALPAGTRSVTVQEWDNCGGATKTALTITVQSDGVAVASPSDNSTVTSPVRYVASANASCSKGVAAMGIYTAPYTKAYVSSGAKLDTSLSLSPGTYNTVVQEWDNCGGSKATPVTITVKSGSGVTVTQPAQLAVVSSPVHYVANASTSCSKGVSAMGIYVDHNLVTTSSGSKLDTSISLPTGVHDTTVKSWDNCGGSSGTPITIQVGTSSTNSVNTFYDLQKSGGWEGWGQLAPKYDICSDCRPQVEWGFKQGISSPSLGGNATRFDLGGTTPYSDALFLNHLIGDFSSQGIPDKNKTLTQTFHNFVYDVYFYGANLQVSHALEFDIGQFTEGRGLMFGTMCRIDGDKQWAIWDNPNAKWINPGVPCKIKNGEWNHLVLKFQRTSDNRLLYQTITLNDETYTLNKYNNSIASDWHGIVLNFQMDGNIGQQDYSVYLDKLNVSYY